MLEALQTPIENIPEIFRDMVHVEETLYNYEDQSVEFYNNEPDYWDKVEINREIKELYESMGIDTGAERTIASELENFNPKNYENMDNVYGNPERALEHWEEQADGTSCALHSQRTIIEELTGEDIDVNEMAEIAKSYGWYDEAYGTSGDCLNKMLDYYGIPNELMIDTTYDQLKSFIMNGDRIIAAVDADEYWFGECDDLFTGDIPNHAVEVIGIDESDPEKPMVILNDSGIPNGRGVKIPADTFMEAWEDSGNLCVRVP